MSSWPLLVACLVAASATLVPEAADLRVLSHLASAGYDGQELADAYEVSSLHAAGVLGAGVRLGIVTWGPANASAFDAYADANQLPRTPLVHRGDCSGPAISEWDLDVQMGKAMAPLASVHVYCAPAPRFADLIAALDAAIVDDVDILSMSWGTCEARVPQATAAAFHRSTANASARGIALFAASGDGGSRECTRWSVGSQEVSTSWPATDPLVLSVGGTRLERGWTETTWNTCAPCPDAEWSASGGGWSALFAAPYWLDAGPRGSPDVAAVADRATGVVVRTGNTWLTMGGTSASAPLWAGAWALVVEREGRMGTPGPLLAAAPAATWRDITEGHNGDHPATPGRDLVTGWGGLQGASLLAHLEGLLPAPSGLDATRGPGLGEVTLSWEPVVGASSYVLHRGPLAGDEAPIAVVTTTTYRDEGLPDGSQWSYRVAAGGAASLPVAGRALAKPDAPRDVVALASPPGAIAVTWSAPAEDGGAEVTLYTVHRTVGSETTLVGTTTGLSFEDDGCPPLALCHYAVAARNLVGDGPAGSAPLPALRV